MMRRLLVEAIRSDPEYMDGNYTKQPRMLQQASVFFATGTNGGNQALFKQAPNAEKADAIIRQRLTGPFRGDANDHLYQWESSRDYDPSAGLEKIQAQLLAINSADDERNPPELGVLDGEIKRVKHGRVLLVPGSPDTAGHGTTARAKYWKDELAKLLASAPRLGH
jgi:homoserine O-acetyltransferase